MTITNKSYKTMLFLLVAMPMAYTAAAGKARTIITAKRTSPNGTLLNAAKIGDSELVKMALENKADVNFENGKPLYLAIGKCYIEVVKTLIAAKANLNLMYKPKSLTSANLPGTPLHCAAKFGNLEIVSALLKAGANVNSKDSTQMTPLHLLIDGAAMDDLKYSHDVLMTSTLTIAKSKNYIDVYNLLLKSGAKIDALGYKSNTPLHTAALWANNSDSFEILKLLLISYSYINADINTQNENQNTPLHEAARACNPLSVTAILEAGANFKLDIYKNINNTIRESSCIRYLPDHLKNRQMEITIKAIADFKSKHAEMLEHFPKILPTVLPLMPTPLIKMIVDYCCAFSKTEDTIGKSENS